MHKKSPKEIPHPMLHGQHQSKSDRLDESLAMRQGKESTKKQSMKDRRDESKAMDGKKGIKTPQAKKMSVSHHVKMMKHHADHMIKAMKKEPKK